MRKYIQLLLILTTLAPLLKAQQDPMFSQYMFNGMAVNPAYAGSRDVLSLTGLARAQWVSVPGAPTTQTFAAHTPDRSGRYGFGLTMVNDKISYLNQTLVNGAFALRIPLRTGTLALGLQGMVSSYRINWNQAYLINPNDAILGTNARNMLLPNAGVGVYYSNDRWFAGAAAPRLLINSISEGKPGISLSQSTRDLAILSRHFFVWTGVALNMSQDVVFRPTLLLKYVEAAPTELDLTAHFILKEKYWIGASYRTGDGVLGMLQYQINPQFMAGYSYDFPLTQLSRFTSGTHELMLRYEFRYGSEAVRSPRFF